MVTGPAGSLRAGTSGSARYRLRRPALPVGPLVPTAEQAVVIGNRTRRLRVLAGPGTGKTATLVEAVAERITGRGVDPRSILLLTFSRRAAAELTDRLTRRLGVTVRDPMVRTLHSYAWSLLRARAAAAGQPPPRLLGGGESDRMVRELLAGHAESAGAGWPEQLRPALTSAAFAAELRDLLMRAAERGVDPGRMAEFGRRAGRPEWVAAARFAREYQQVSDLRQGTSGLGVALDQADLTRAALAALTQDDVGAAEQARVRHLFVDEYQDVDPAQVALIERLAAGAAELVVVGDPDQSVYSFRGSDPGALGRLEADATVALSLSRRSGTTLLAATRRISGLLPGIPSFPRHRELTAADPERRSDLDIRVLPTAAREAAYVADQLRRAHLLEGVPWSRMAVVVRSPAAALPALRRSFAVAAIPLAVSADDRTPMADPVAAALVSVLECGLDATLVSGQRALDLLASPVGGLDALGLRRLRRAVRAAGPDAGSSADQIAAILLGAPLPAGLPDDLSRPPRKLAELLRIVGSAADGTYRRGRAVGGLAGQRSGRSTGDGSGARRQRRPARRRSARCGRRAVRPGGRPGRPVAPRGCAGLRRPGHRPAGARRSDRAGAASG